MSVFLQYWFWLVLVSLLCFALERIYPWRPQRALRDQIGQDLFWLVFNGHYLGLGLAMLGGALLDATGLTHPGWRVLEGLAPWLQFLIFLAVKDLIEWCIHNLLHRVPWLWEFHKLHHSILTLDWIGNMRFHWLEVVVYKTISYLPLVILGADGRVLLAVSIFSTLIGHLNHSNLAISWGPLRYLFNSPKMHVWHHDVIPRGGHGKNFGVVFSAWDWLFGTAYMPREGQPSALGFEGQEDYPTGLLGRFFYPLTKLRVR